MDMFEFNDAVKQIQDLIDGSNSKNPAKAQAALPDLFIKAAINKLTFIPMDSLEGIPEPICKIVIIGNQYHYCVPTTQL